MKTLKIETKNVKALQSAALFASNDTRRPSIAMISISKTEVPNVFELLATNGAMACSIKFNDKLLNIDSSEEISKEEIKLAILKAKLNKESLELSVEQDRREPCIFPVDAARSVFARGKKESITSYQAKYLADVIKAAKLLNKNSYLVFETVLANGATLIKMHQKDDFEFQVVLMPIKLK